MRFLVFSDFHAHNFVEGSTRESHDTLPGLFNSRLLAACKVLDEIRDYAVENKINNVVFCGDLFHKRMNIDVDVLNLIDHHISLFANHHITMTMLVGNHDYADKFGNVHSLHCFKNHEHCLVLDRPSAFSLFDPTLPVDQDHLFGYAIPYYDDIEQTKAALDSIDSDYALLLMHVGMQGARVGSDYVLVKDTDVQVTDVPKDRFQLCLFGHYHEHQRLFDNGWYVGATFQHNWGDANTIRGFLDVSLERGEDPVIRLIESKAAPRYWKFDEKDYKTFLPKIRTQDIVRITGDEKKATKLLAKLACMDARVIPDAVDTTNPDAEELPLSTLDPKNMVDYWVQESLGSLDEELVKLGKSLLAEAEGNKL